MDSEIKEMLQANLELSKENNELLKKVRGVQKRAAAASIAYWSIIILIALGAYYYVQPYVGKFQTLYDQGMSNIEQIKNIGNSFSNIGGKK